MAEHSTIEWTDATWNPITGCTLVSTGCKFCYAATLAAGRLKNHPSRQGLARVNAAGEAKFTGEVRFNPQWLDQPLRWSRPRKIFVCAHSDLFHEAVPDEWIDQVFAVMALAPQHVFQVLTKRPERMAAYLDQAAGRIGDMAMKLRHSDAAKRAGMGPSAIAPLPYISPGALWWPLSHVWLGTSVEDQATADERIPHLLAAPAAVHFLSAEPLLGPLEIGFALKQHRDKHGIWRAGGGLDWVIVGGESGKHARPMHPDWARSLRDQCSAAGVAFLFKQWGEWAPSSPEEAQGNPRSGMRCLKGHLYVARAEDLTIEAGAAFIEQKGKKAAGRLLDGRTWDQMPGDLAL